MNKFSSWICTQTYCKNR